MQQEHAIALQLIIAEDPKAHTHATIIRALRINFAYMLGKLERSCNALASVYRKATHQYNSTCVQHDAAESGTHVVVHQDPNTIRRSMAQCVENMRLAQEAGRRSKHLSADAVYIAAGRLHTHGCMLLNKIAFEIGGRPAIGTLQEIVQQLVAVLPVVVADLKPTYNGEYKDRHIQVFLLSNARGCQAYYALLTGDATFALLARIVFAEHILASWHLFVWCWCWVQSGYPGS
jgi:hypothetical protein